MFKSEAVPSIPELPAGSWRIQWLGSELQTAKHAPNPSGYQVQVHLRWASTGERAPKSVWVPLSNLPYLRTQSLWEERKFASLCEAESRTFTVHVQGAKLKEIQRPFADYLIKHGEYDLQDFDSLAACWVFNTSDGEDLIVPCWEILRAWYLFDHGVMPAILAGAISDVERLPNTLKPWRDGTGTLPDGRYQYVYPRWLGEAGARRFARLLFDGFAHSESCKIYSILLSTSSSQAKDGWIRCRLPAVLPPFESPSHWTVKCIPLQPLGSSGRKRWLALDLQGCTGPLPFSDLSALPHQDTRQGQNADDPSLPTRFVQGKAPVSLPDGPMELISAAPDENIDESTIDGFGFYDNIDTDLEVSTPIKKKQVSRVRHTKGNEGPTAGGGTDPAGPTKPGATRVRVQNGASELTKDDVLQQTLRAFRLIVGRAASGCHARLIHTNGNTFAATNRATKIVRQFAILEMSFPNGRTAYVLDAQRFGSEQFSFFICKSPGSYGYAKSVLEPWLSNFPAPKGSPWVVEAGFPRGMVSTSRRVIHQPETEGSDVESRVQRLAERISDVVKSFA